MCILIGELPVHTQAASSFTNIHQMVPSYQELGFRRWQSKWFYHSTDKLQNLDARPGYSQRGKKLPQKKFL